jgi:hypothetical protein
MRVARRIGAAWTARHGRGEPMTGTTHQGGAVGAGDGICGGHGIRPVEDAGDRGEFGGP